MAAAALMKALATAALAAVVAEPPGPLARKGLRAELEASCAAEPCAELSLLQLQGLRGAGVAARAAEPPPTYQRTPPHIWPQKNGNARRTGASAVVGVGPTLGEPLWVVEEPGPGVLYQSPVMDSEGNIYMSSTDGEVRSMRLADGKRRWTTKLTEFGSTPQLPTPILLRDALYTVDGTGDLVCLSLGDGSERWRVRYSDGASGGDSWSLGGSDGVVLAVATPTSEHNKSEGSGTWLYALSAADGAALWSFRMPFGSGFNVMPAITGGAVYVADMFGGLSAVNLADGTPRWEQGPPFEGPSFTTGGLALGPEGLDVAFVSSNSDARGCAELVVVNPSNCGDGLVVAYDLATGKERWRRAFTAFPANTAPTVFERKSGGHTVLIGTGKNPPLPYHLAGLDAARTQPDRIVALDAATGEELWAFETPLSSSLAGSGSVKAQICWPDTFSNAAIGGDGTVYVGWYGGRLFALDGETGAKLSEYDGGSSFQAEPAIAPGMVVAASCKAVYAFGSPR